MAEYRELPDDALDTYQSFLSYAFNPTGDVYEPEEDELPIPAQVGERRGLFEGDELRSVCAHHFFRTLLRDEWFEIGGLSAVATPPEFRRKGHVRKMLESALEEYRERDVFLSALWPFDHGFYRKFGWELGTRLAVETGPPDALDFAHDDGHGHFERMAPDDWEALNEVLLEHGSRYDLTVDRTEEWWRKRVFSGWESDPYVYGWLDDGDVRGYVVYQMREDDDGETELLVWELAYVDHDARTNLLRLLANHDSQVQQLRRFSPPDDLLLDSLPDPRAFEYAIKPGAMVRLVDVGLGLEAISYPRDLSSTCSIHVSDPMVDWNSGVFDVTFQDGEATVEHRQYSSPSDSAGTEPTDADVSLDIGSLSQLFVGYRTVSDLAESGSISISDSTAAETLGSAFPSRNCFLGENF
ncbi:MAG: enhanced intracellular survival protein Eis [Halodesulfurarchaeum sp.]